MADAASKYLDALAQWGKLALDDILADARLDEYDRRTTHYCGDSCPSGHLDDPFCIAEAAGELQWVRVEPDKQ